MTSKGKPRVYRSAGCGWGVIGGGVRFGWFHRWESAMEYAVSAPRRKTVRVPAFEGRLGPYEIVGERDNLHLIATARPEDGIPVPIEQLYVLAMFLASASMYYTPELWK